MLSESGPKLIEWRLRHLDVINQHVTLDRIGRSVCWRHLHLNIPESAFLLFPVRWLLCTSKQNLIWYGEYMFASDYYLNTFSSALAPDSMTMVDTFFW